MSDLSELDKEKLNSQTLAKRLRERIRREGGAVSFRDWMEAALYDESEGYYRRHERARWGRTGDYRTSPERSPLFAATFARYFATLYQELGSPTAWTILEAGAGAGHFARGVLETLQRFFPQVFSATLYVIDESSADAVEQARETLGSCADRVEFLSLDQLKTPLDTGLIFSNELLDAMPVHRVIMRGGRLRELCVGLSESDDFTWTEREPTTPQLTAYFAELNLQLAEGQIAEVNLAAADWLCRAASKLKQGYLVTVDYGAEAAELFTTPHRREGTLRGFRQHHFVQDVLASPGTHDLTTTIDWTHIKKAGETCGLETITFEQQDQFLLKAGLLGHLEALTAGSLSESEILILRTGARDMILPTSMSASFQVLVQRCSG